MDVLMNLHLPKAGYHGSAWGHLKHAVKPLGLDRRGVWGCPAIEPRLVMLRILASIILGTAVSLAPARAQSNFEELAGAWSGGGMMKPSDGPRERVRCKINYIPKNQGQSLKMEVRCASDAYKMNLTANIDQNGSAISGDWFESEYRQGGKVSGQSSEGLIEAKVESQTVVALLTVRTKGNRQSFEMESPGLWVSEVQIDLVHDGR
jgi:hypothetical protein